MLMAMNDTRRSERVWLDRNRDPINVDRAWQKSDARIALSRRQQAMLAAAGEAGPSARWYVLQVKNGKDIAVDKLLEEANIERWMAQETKVVRRRGRYGMMRPEAKTIPFLPGYIFVKVVWCAPCWHALMALKGVAGILCSGGHPAAVADDKLLKLRADVEHDPEAIRAYLKKFNVGDKVSIDHGPFASFPGEVVEVDDRGKALIEVMIFGRAVSVALDLVQISKS